ncbi:hypothetical protein NUITMVS3_38930 [Shewanella xiamenensis]|jgi:hypothetical protein|nr:hypothetical protein NUITMVS2_15230 [Shewanella xiamenensis]GLD79459.1 hypothetical protein NUITMVS3_38930 [Shewanella xiamenensis]
MASFIPRNWLGNKMLSSQSASVNMILKNDLEIRDKKPSIEFVYQPSATRLIRPIWQQHQNINTTQ